jgi:predicted O-methyltransferase YrrM
LSIQGILKKQAARQGYLLSRYQTAHRAEWLRDILRTSDERILLLDYGEAAQILSALRATAHLPGDIAELGVAWGASARLIAANASGRTVHLFDTFGGLPKPSAVDSAKFAEGDFNSQLQDVQQYLSGYDCRFYKGFFPQTAAPLAEAQFSFVHLDVDIYESTLAGLEFFFPRLVRGGILISHDFLSADGVDRAMSEFFADKAERPIELAAGYQCMIVKTSE